MLCDCAGSILLLPDEYTFPVMTGPALPCNYGDIDWNEVWKAKQDRYEGARIPGDSSHDWNKKENAERYASQSEGEFEKRIRLTLAGLSVNRSTRILDIGSGPGTLAIPLAPQVQEITAVEPGEGMVSALEQRAKRAGIANIHCVPKVWEDVNPEKDIDGPYDLVIASLSLTMRDIREAVLKMDTVSCGDICLYWFVDLPFWEKMYADLSRPLHGKSYCAGPKADCLWNVLFQAGIYANIEMLPLDKEYRFPSREEMTTFFRKRFGVRTKKQEKVLDAYLGPLIQEDANGVIVSGESTFAKIWWRKRTQ